MRKSKIRVGEMVWIRRCLAFEMPVGLHDGDSVRVLEYIPSQSVTVQTLDGRTFDLDPIHIDTGWVFLLGGKTFGEHTGRAKVHIRKMIAELRRNPHPRYPEMSEEQANEWLTVLARNEAPLAMAA